MPIQKLRVKKNSDPKKTKLAERKALVQKIDTHQRQLEEMDSEDQQEVISIDRAEQVGEFSIALTFDDGSRQTVDFERFLRQSRHPLIRSYLIPAKFAQFTVRDGDLIWGDYDLCFPIGDLYDGRI